MKTSALVFALVLGMLSPSFAGERRLRVEVRIAEVSAEEGGKRTLLKRKQAAEAKAGANLAVVATAGKAFMASAFSEFIAPKTFSAPEYGGDPKVIHREDGSILLASADLADGVPSKGPATEKDMSSFPLTPVTPKAFEKHDLGWEIEGTPRITADGLVILEAEVRHHDARPATAEFGEGAGPIVTMARTAFGKEVEVVLTENRAQRASTSVTRTPLLLRARPGVTYPVEVMCGDRAVAATIRCTLVGE